MRATIIVLGDLSTVWRCNLERRVSAAQLHRREWAVIEAVYRHPLNRNLAWQDVLRLIGHLGKAELKHDGKWLFEINGFERTFPTPHGAHMEADEVVKLKEFLNEVGFSRALVP